MKHTYSNLPSPSDLTYSTLNPSNVNNNLTKTQNKI